MKQKLIDGLTEATKESSKALESISQSMVAVGKSVGDGLALLATALSRVQIQQTPQGYAEYSPHNYPALQFFNSFSRNADELHLDVAESLDLPLNGKKRTCILKKLQLFTVGLFKYVTPFVTTTQPVFTCSKSTTETPEQGVKYFQS